MASGGKVIDRVLDSHGPYFSPALYYDLNSISFMRQDIFCP